MKMKINYHPVDASDCLVKIITNAKDIESFLYKQFSGGNKSFLILIDDPTDEFYLTHYIEDVYDFLEYMTMYNNVYIQEFRYKDWPEIMGYLSDLMDEEYGWKSAFLRN